MGVAVTRALAGAGFGPPARDHMHCLLYRADSWAGAVTDPEYLLLGPGICILTGTWCLGRPWHLSPTGLEAGGMAPLLAEMSLSAWSMEQSQAGAGQCTQAGASKACWKLLRAAGGAPLAPGPAAHTCQPGSEPRN